VSIVKQAFVIAVVSVALASLVIAYAALIQGGMP
jgi:hypothetical protein